MKMFENLAWRWFIWYMKRRGYPNMSIGGRGDKVVRIEFYSGELEEFSEEITCSGLPHRCPTCPNVCQCKILR